MMKNRPLVLVYAILLLAAACESTTYIDQDAVIEAEVQKRLDKFQKIRMQRCREDILREAAVIADSIVLNMAKAALDTSSLPYKPNRPEKPLITATADSLKLAPLFEE